MAVCWKPWILESFDWPKMEFWLNVYFGSFFFFKGDVGCLALPDVQIVEIDFCSIHCTSYPSYLCRWSCFIRNSPKQNLETTELLDTLNYSQWKNVTRKSKIRKKKKTWRYWHSIHPSNVRQEPWVPSSPLWMPCWAFATPRPIFERFMGGKWVDNTPWHQG